MMELEGGKLPRPFTDKSFEEKITRFHSMMREITLQDMEASPEERRQIIADTLRFGDFCDHLQKLFGETIQSKDMKGVYRKISTNPDANIDWCELFGYQENGLQNEGNPPVMNEGNVFAVNFRTRAGNASMDKRRGDTTRGINYSKHIENYIIASKKGIVTLWNMKQPAHKLGEIFLLLYGAMKSDLENVYTTDIPDTAWLVECIYLPNLRRLLCVTERSIIIWDPRAKLTTLEFYIIRSFENAFVSMTYIPSTDPTQEIILLGDDQGYVSMVTITTLDLSPKMASSVKRITASNRTLYTLSYKKLTIPIKKRRLHTDWVLKLSWIEDQQCVASCCASGKNSFIMDEIPSLFNHEVVLKSADVFRGVNTFVYSDRANVVCTAGADKIIRLWHPNILTRPTGKLIGHLFTIVDIAINEKDQHIISLSSARVIRVWCMNTMASLQIFTDNDDRAGEKRIQALLYDQKYERLLTGSGVIDCWSLSRTVIDSLVVPQTHDRSIVKLIYNTALTQFLSICSEPIIKVWDSEKGNLAYQLTSPHGPGVDVTSLSISTSGYRLATGASDGSIKIWDVGAGQELKYHVEKIPAALRESEKPGSVLCLQFLPHSADKQRLLVAAGWKNEMRLYSDADTESDLVYLRSFDDSWRTFSSMGMSRSSTLLSSLSTHYRKVPPIGVVLTTGAKGRVQKILDTEQVYCMQLYECEESTTLLVGTQSGAVILWDGASFTIRNILRVPEQSESAHSDVLNSGKKKRVNRVGILLHSVLKEPEKPLSPLSSEEDTPEPSSPSSSPTTEGDTVTDNQADSQVEQDEGIEVDHVEGEQEEDVEEEINTNEADKRIEYPAVIISLHEDAGIRLWSMTGLLLHETVAMTRQSGIPVTSYATDKHCNVLITGDRLGYLTLWDMTAFLQEQSDSIKQVISWRAHTSKITSVVIPDTQRLLIYSSSIDGSVRIWFDRGGRYLGYLGQGRPLVLPAVHSAPSHTASPQPCDITEKPLDAIKPVRREKNVTQDRDIPLISSVERLSPFRRSAYLRNQGEHKEPEDKKFFRSLTKPKQYNSHLEPLSEISDLKSSLECGFVFRSLPVYRVSTPKLIRHPGTSIRPADDLIAEHKQSQVAKNRVRVGKRPP